MKVGKAHQRGARWLLETRDRVNEDEFVLTQIPCPDARCDPAVGHCHRSRLVGGLLEP